MIDPSVEHSRKPKSTLIRGLLSHSFRLAYCTWTQWTLNMSSVSACDQSHPGSPPPKLKHKFRAKLMKRRGGGEPGDEASIDYAFYSWLC